MGLRDPVRLGGALRARGRNLDLSFGDDVVPLRLPTDLFDAGHALYTRGVGVDFRRGATRARLMGGSTSTVYSTPFYSAARSDDPIGMFQLESTVAPNFTVSLRNLVYQRQTHLLGLDWSPPGPVRAALAAGTGAGEPYAAASLAYDRDWLSVKAAWAHAGDSFHRVLTRQAQGSEVDRENVVVSIRPSRSATFVLGRNHYLQPSTPGRPVVRGMVHQFLASSTIGGTRINAALFSSESPDAGGGVGASIGAGRDVASFLRLDASLQHSDPRRSRAVTSLLGQVRERLSERLRLEQIVTATKNHTTVSIGGSFLSNPITVGLEYQTIYLPFSARGGFDQALMLTLRLQPGGNLQGNLASYLGPDGRVRYTAYGHQYFYGGGEAPPPAARLHRNLVKGRVVDEAGDPVAGAALRIGVETVFTDSRGTFFLRVRKEAEYPLEMLLDQFLAAGRYEVIEAPATVHSRPEDETTEVIITLRSVRPEARPDPAPADLPPSPGPSRPR